VDPLIVSVALTGTRTTKEQNPHVPITPAEIVDTAVACREEGAAIVHIHARDRNGKMTQDPAIIEQTVTGMRPDPTF
jgi:3-keto-5-aminohexanoate cleavage enzyme